MVSSTWTAVVTALTVSFLSFGFAQSLNGSRNDDSLPIVDLDYQRQQANAYNASGRYYEFSNIRYAAPPTGANRFKAPSSPAVNRSAVQVGHHRRICPQAKPSWESISSKFVPLYLKGQRTFTESEFNKVSNTSPYLLPQDSMTTEDCLFLDVMVPQGIFDKAGSGSGAPVLVWFHGGGYVKGSKTGDGNPAGLITRSESNQAPGVIFVAINYRLGAFGWLSGPTFQKDGDANAGLLDQRFALEWIRNHIAKFGGDPKRVTVFGESAGGGSIMHQITAYGGDQGPLPFQQAIPQSPAILPIISDEQKEQTFRRYLQLLGVDTIAKARELPYHKLQEANILQIAASPYGTFTYGPATDGKFVPALPGELLLQGRFDKSLKIMVGQNAQEGLDFTSPFIQNDSALTEVISSLFPAMRNWPEGLSYVTDTLYPPVFDGSQAQGYRNQIARAAAIISEALFTCNAVALNKAFENKTFAYLYSVSPALHGHDVRYTFYNGVQGSVKSTWVATVLQKYITHFAETGTPNEYGVPRFPMYGDGATVQELKNTKIKKTKNPAANYRCDWWQKALSHK